jgi:stage III sporulation protein AF
MNEAIRDWIIGIAGAAMVSAAAQMMTPEGRVKRIVSLVCGMVTILALIRPLVGFDLGRFADYAARYRLEAEAVTADMNETEEKLTRRIIEEKSAAYILDKGKSLGITDLEARVTAVWNEDGYWVPESARLETDAGEGARRKLAETITAELGIPEEELSWSMKDEK